MIVNIGVDTLVPNDVEQNNDRLEMIVVPKDVELNNNIWRLY